MTTILPFTSGSISFAGKTASRPAQTPTSAPASALERGGNALERLIRITQSNDLLLAELATARRRCDHAIAYRDDPVSASDLGAALVAHARQKRARIEARLRANRTEALAILAGSSCPA